MLASNWSQIEMRFQPELCEKVVGALWKIISQSEQSDDEILERYKILIEVLSEDFLKKNPSANPNKINENFAKAVKEKDLTLFKSIFKDLSSEVLINIAQGEDIIINPPAENNPTIEHADIADLKQYMEARHISASVSISNHHASYSANLNDITTETPLSMHSIGKVFTEILLMKMIRDGIIKEDDLEKPIQLDNDVLSQLSVDVRDRLQHATFKQILTHHSGLGNYLTKQFEMIDKAKSGKPIPLVQNSRELLKYHDENVEKLGDFHYSNLGILLVGLSIEHHYNKFLKEQEKPSVTIDEIMQSFALNEVKMTMFSSHMPPKVARFNPENPYIKYLYGSPAGGHWTTTGDMQKFALWVQKKCQDDPVFKQLIIKHGEEFYDKDSDTLGHGGDLPTDSAWFYCSLKKDDDTSLCILSDQGGRTAKHLAQAILRQTAWYKPVLASKREVELPSTSRHLPAFDLHKSNMTPDTDLSHTSTDISQSQKEKKTTTKESKPYKK